MKLEVVTLPVSDLDRAKSFYQSLGWELDADFDVGDVRAVQLTPPQSECSVSFGRGLTPAGAGLRSAVGAGRLRHRGGARGSCPPRGRGQRAVPPRAGALHPGPDPERRSYLTYASFNDPDGNGWLLQEVTMRLPGPGLALQAG